ncbi:MAG: phosphatidate cytidylyltransferase [Spirochaetaceae bacterium]|jgi:dolichol kinase|nr:phosphatidate cytidylyltransferase [Spirochaetaceae bacterium]
MRLLKTPLPEDLKTELARKSIHLFIGVCPALAAWDRNITLGLLAAGAALYTALEALRFSGRNIPLFSKISARASRKRDKGRFILAPLTLGLGAAGALLFYTPRSAALGIYAAAFGDSAASVAGTLFGRVRPAFLGGKSLEGSLACFAAVFLAARGLPLPGACAAALAAALVEALPLKDFDNLALPLAVGLVSDITPCGGFRCFLLR